MMFDLKLLERASLRSLTKGAPVCGLPKVTRKRRRRDVFEVLEYRAGIRSIPWALVCGADAGSGEFRRVTAYVIPNEKRSDATR
jgi:hypothetical protein